MYSASLYLIRTSEHCKLVAPTHFTFFTISLQLVPYYVSISEPPYLCITSITPPMHSRNQPTIFNGHFQASLFLKNLIAPVTWIHNVSSSLPAVLHSVFPIVLSTPSSFHSATFPLCLSIIMANHFFQTSLHPVTVVFQHNRLHRVVTFFCSCCHDTHFAHYFNLTAHFYTPIHDKVSLRNILLIFLLHQYCSSSRNCRTKGYYYSVTFLH